MWIYSLLDKPTNENHLWTTITIMDI